MDQRGVPAEMLDELGNDTPDFLVKAKRREPPKLALANIGFAAMWLTITGVNAAGFLGPVLMGRSVHLTVNGVPTVAGPGNMAVLFMPAAIITLFTVVGVAIGGNGVFMLLAHGGWFAGTAKRLIEVQGKTTRSIGWEQFTGDITAEGALQNRSISLVLKTGKMVHHKDGPDTWQPDMVYLTGINESERVEAIIRQRIQEAASRPTVAAAPASPAPFVPPIAPLPVATPPVAPNVVRPPGAPHTAPEQPPEDPPDEPTILLTS